MSGSSDDTSGKKDTASIKSDVPAQETKPVKESAENPIKVPATKPDISPAKKNDAKPAAKSDSEKPAAKPAPPKPAPAKEADVPEFEQNMADKISERFGAIVQVKPRRIKITSKKEDLKEVAEFIRDELGFDHAESVSGVDYPEDNEIEVVYHLGSYTESSLAGHVLSLATRVPREQVPDPGNDTSRLSSLREVFYSVEFHERECFEMLGVYFEGHPDNRRLLLPEDWADLPPLRKDFAIKGR